MAVHNKNINHQPASMDSVLVAKKREWQLVEYILPPRQTEISTVLLASSRCIGLDFPTLDSNWYSRLLSFSTSTAGLSITLTSVVTVSKTDTET